MWARFGMEALAEYVAASVSYIQTTSAVGGAPELVASTLCPPRSTSPFSCGLFARRVRVVICFTLRSRRDKERKGSRRIPAEKEGKQVMATMAVSAASSSLRLLPSVDGLRVHQQSPACGRAAPFLKEKSHRRCSIIAEGVESTTTSTATTSAASSSRSSEVVTIEYQRQRAKELQEYFADKKYEEEVIKGRTFGWTRKSEITNGRWTMFGIAVGLLTEFATGADFIEQLRIIVSNLGILDLD
ncbi:hypothetical protein R1sor_017589 [Riccia sorocarpa]|uniref:Uncharacterized protein n=1 Tax=Riccia sorocarpa TaxID=122646 RepID=A0ABD3IBB9_9MARC